MADEQVATPEPTIITFCIERLVNGYVVMVGEGAGNGVNPAYSPVRHLVTSRAALIELLTDLAPVTLSRAPTSPWSEEPLTEKVW